MYVALPAGHPLARKRNLTLEELSEESWVLGTTGSCPDASIFLRSCQIAGFEPNIAFNSDDYFAIQGFVSAGIGASFIPDLALISVREDIVVRSMGPKPPARVDLGRDAARQLLLAGQAGDARRARRGRRRLRRQPARARPRQLKCHPRPLSGRVGTAFMPGGRGGTTSPMVVGSDLIAARAAPARAIARDAADDAVPVALDRGR